MIVFTATAVAFAAPVAATALTHELALIAAGLLTAIEN